jgi:UDP-N-acetylmuramoyl-L-alanyl-D-glutamate--2,6-diaminopimelate ligase
MYSKITDNSRDITPGALFISRPCANAQQYLNDALVRGAAGVLLPANHNLSVPPGPTISFSFDINTDTAKLAREYMPNLPKHLCGITGTKGKTSIVALVRQILQILGKKSATIGTLGVVSDDWSEPGRNTTPFPIELAETLQKLAENGTQYVAMELSSIGLDEKRAEFLPFDAIGFSNFSRDHLDYHGTMENYFATKARLFSNDFNYKTAVINADDEWAKKLTPHSDIINIGFHGDKIKIISIRPNNDGQDVELIFFGKNYRLKTPLLGTFQIYNILIAIGLVIGMGIAPDEIPLEKLFSELRAPRGRCEFVGNTRTGAAVYVDYAHTPDSLEKILETLREHTKNKLSVVFGCGGNRDMGKRAIMGKIANDLADNVIITDDNPRNENPDLIREQIMTACPSARNMGDRELAIKTAISELSDGDILVIAGKGHEDYQLIGDKKYHFDDAEIAKKNL